MKLKLENKALITCDSGIRKLKEKLKKNLLLTNLLLIHLQALHHLTTAERQKDREREREKKRKGEEKERKREGGKEWERGGKAREINFDHTTRAYRAGYYGNTHVSPTRHPPHHHLQGCGFVACWFLVNLTELWEHRQEDHHQELSSQLNRGGLSARRETDRRRRERKGERIGLTEREVRRDMQVKYVTQK